MRRLLSGGLVVFAGVVSLPVGGSPHKAQPTPAPDIRPDPRFETLRRFFEKSDCPAREYAFAFLEAADYNDLDWRLLPSISYVESTGGKYARHNNLFGWDAGNAQFRSPADAIHAVGKRLAQSDLYRDKSLDEVLAIYNPNAAYARKVKSVMRRIAPLQ